MNKKPYILPSVSIIKIATGNMLQGASGQTTLDVSEEEQKSGWAESRSFYFEEISEEE